jgi:hypothetical protein
MCILDTPSATDTHVRLVDASTAWCLQAHTASGSSIYAEQISHHPPVTAFHVEGPAGLFSFDGLSQPEVSFSGGGLKTSAHGYRRITFASDGGVIEVGC